MLARINVMFFFGTYVISCERNVTSLGEQMHDVPNKCKAI
jgi:hypothetical protein